ncbi:hypothetical protein [Mycolicibacterium holsaticum]|uniref:hypothetical protein n=1 Tax=Mycolicibacterium holsaticum TaxID=152142 RepID=UPI001F424BBC|nr:hypothetical protein [Mycolicibacterium holsaticum]
MSEIHLDNLHYLARAGVVIFPPVVGYYARPVSVEEVTTNIAGRVLDQLGISHSLIKRWREDPDSFRQNGFQLASGNTNSRRQR